MIGFLKGGMGELVARAEAEKALRREEQNRLRLAGLMVNRIRAARLRALFKPSEGGLEPKPKAVILEVLDPELAYLGDLSIWGPEIGVNSSFKGSTGVLHLREEIVCTEESVNLAAEGEELVFLPVLGVRALEAAEEGWRIIPVSPSFTLDPAGPSFCHLRR